MRSAKMRGGSVDTGALLILVLLLALLALAGKVTQ
jgi:hypothetical protein